MRLGRLVACAATAFAVPGFAAAPNMKEGLWEITTRMEMVGMPGGMPPQTFKQCITRKDLENPHKMATPGGPKDDRCQVSDYKLQGNTATWNWTCKGGEEMRGTATMTFSGTTYTGVSKMSMQQGGQTHNMTVHYSGKHVGDCK